MIYHTRAVDVVRRACTGISVAIVFHTASLVVQRCVVRVHETFAKAAIQKGASLISKLSKFQPRREF